MNLSALPTLWLGMFGSGPLGRTGWLDTPFPPIVSMLAIARLVRRCCCRAGVGSSRPSWWASA